MGLSIDWAREFATCDLDYYRHQQKLFLDFLQGGLVYRKKRKVNWDPVDQTVLANEQVVDGRGWRSGAVVEKRELNQWVFKITDYAQDLLDDLETLDRWPEKVRLMQENWIGRSEGLQVRFALDPRATRAGAARDASWRSTPPRPDTLFGANFVALAPTIRWRRRRRRRIPALAAFIAECKRHGTAQARSRPPRRWASTPASARCIRSIRAGSCRSRSRTSS